MMYRFSWKRCIGFHPKSWKRGLWNGNIGCSQQTTTGYYFSEFNQGCFASILTIVIVIQMGWEKTTNEKKTLKLRVAWVNCFRYCVFCVCGGVDPMQFVSTFQSRSGFKKTPASTKKRIGHEFLAAEERRSGKFRFKTRRYHLVHKKWRGWFWRDGGRKYIFFTMFKITPG